LCTGICLGGQNTSRDYFNNLTEKVTESLYLGTFPVATEFTPIDVAFTLWSQYLLADLLYA